MTVEETKTAIELIMSSIDILQHQIDIVDKIWTYFAMISVGTLGFTINTKNMADKMYKLLAFQFGYASFCVGNWLALSGAYRTLNVINTKANQCIDDLPFCDVAKSFNSGIFDLPLVNTFYGAMVLAVLFGNYLAYKNHTKVKPELA